MPSFYHRAAQCGSFEWLCKESQHVDLPENVADFYFRSRTIHLNPLLQFLYWHMNYHTDHHIYAAVPCYRLSRLHRVIRADMPPCHRGLVSVWREVMATMRQRERDPSYQFLVPMPVRRARTVALKRA